MFACKICDKQQKSKDSLYNHYKYHLKKETDEIKKNKISMILSNIKIKCDTCKLSFSPGFTLSRHKKTCTSNSEKKENVSSNINSNFSSKLDELKHIFINSLSEDDKAYEKSLNIFDDLSKMLNVSPAKLDTTSTNIGGNNGNIINSGSMIGELNINNNVFNGVRNVDTISENMYDGPLQEIPKLKSLFRVSEMDKNVDKIFLSLDKFINCNADYPENHNIVVTNNKKYKPCLVKENNKWITKQGEDMKKLFYDRISNCNILYMDLIPEKLKEIYPEKSESIDKISNHISDMYSNETDLIKKRLWSQLFEQTYASKDILIESYKKDKELIQS